MPRPPLFSKYKLYQFKSRDQTFFSSAKAGTKCRQQILSSCRSCTPLDCNWRLQRSVWSFKIIKPNLFFFQRMVSELPELLSPWHWHWHCFPPPPHHRGAVTSEDGIRIQSANRPCVGACWCWIAHRGLPGVLHLQVRVRAADGRRGEVQLNPHDSPAIRNKERWEWRPPHEQRRNT